MKHIREKILTMVVMTSIVITGCTSNPIGDVINEVKDQTVGEQSGSGNLTIVEEKEFDGKDIKEIDVRTNTVSVFISPSTDNKAKIQLKVDETISNKFNFDAKVKSGTLTIEVEEKDKNKLQINDSLGQRILSIELPQQEYDRLTYNSDIGDTRIEQLQFNDIKLNTSIGRIVLDEVEGEMDIKTETGLVEVSLEELKEDVTVETEVGEVNINIEKQTENMKLDLSSEIGKVETDLEGFDFAVRSSREIVGSKGTAGAKILARTEIGKIGVYTK